MITASQVANATRGQLLKITYDLLLESLDNVKQYGHEKTEDQFAKEIGRSRQILQELIDTLDFTQEISKDLLRIYVYINGLLIKNLMVYDESLIDESKMLINQLVEGWDEVIAKDHESLKVMNNTQQLYAGLTYGKNDLNESVLEKDNRGFKA
ncbi:MAG TPA: flagellar protein FliS [Epulopiscium sp.]|nr:flagellar protein FliS [Candidatus Epulonipiscium sp.]